MKYKKLFYVVSFLLLCILGNSIYLDAKCKNIIESNISEFQNKTNCNSANIVVYDDGKVSYYGNDKEEGLYQIGSMTKAFTGLGIMKLMREGKIIPENEVSFYLPGFKAYYEGEKVDITVDELLSQTSGFTNSERNYPSAKANMTLSEWMEQISGSELRYRPGICAGIFFRLIRDKKRYRIYQCEDKGKKNAKALISSSMVKEKMKKLTNLIDTRTLI